MTPIRRLLVANRGEIACRIMRTANALGIETVAVYSGVDRAALHVEMADHAVHIGQAPATDSYLSIDRILEAAELTGADAIHPGYGFLSENAAFASACVDRGVTFVGPSPHAIETMGDKARAKREMIAAGVPCVPGYQGEDQSDDTLVNEAANIGFPVMIKAAAGGGGRGMRLVHDASDVADAVLSARSEAQSAFGSGELILERAIVRPRHVEVQVFGDSHGNLVHLGERDCSVQRRHQKIIEEAPCPVMTPDLRTAMGVAAVDAARAVDYVGAGTVEFLLLDDGTFYFLEMNTRLQVEHPVTELVTGVDLVEMQLRVAQGEPLAFSQDDVRLTGHAIEARLYAEDARRDFLPSTGTIERWVAPTGDGIRVDTGVREGSNVSPFYDPMLAKVIGFGATRDEARRRLVESLGASMVVGAETNRDLLIDVLERDSFANGEATTAFVDDEYGGGFVADPTVDDLCLAAAVRVEMGMRSALDESLGVDRELLNWSSSGLLESVTVHEVHGEPITFTVQSGSDGRRHVTTSFGDLVDVAVREVGDHHALVEIDGRRATIAHHVHNDGRTLTIATRVAQFAVRDLSAGVATDDAAGTGVIAAPMHGQLLEVFVRAGDAVVVGQRLAVLEAMKMQHEIVADVDGTVVAVHECPAQVGAGDLVIEIEPDS